MLRQAVTPLFSSNEQLFSEIATNKRDSAYGTLLGSFDSVGISAPRRLHGSNHTVQVILSSGTGTISIECSQDGTNWEEAFEMVFGGSGSDADGISNRAWRHIRANVTAIGTAGTDAFTVYVKSA